MSTLELLVVAAVAVAFGGASRHAAGNGENGAVVAAAAFGGASGHAACNLKPSKGRRH